mgnify:CR=1 FL=1
MAAPRWVSSTTADGDVGFLTKATNSADTLSWDYDLVGQVLSEGSTRNATTVSYLYNLAGQRSTVRLNGADFLTYGYYPDGLLQSSDQIRGRRLLTSRTTSCTAGRPSRYP